MNRRTVLKGGIALAATAHTAVFAPAVISSISASVARFRTLNAAWLATADAQGDIAAEGPQYEAAWGACKDFIRHQCSTPEEVQEKLRAVVADEWLHETAETGWDENHGYLHGLFIRSLII